MLSARLWADDSTDTAAKLSDPKPLTPDQRERARSVSQPSVRMQKANSGIRQPSRRVGSALFPRVFPQRSDEIFYRLASGEIPVGVANKLSIESTGKLQVDTSKGQAAAVRVDEAQRQRAAEALLQASAQIAASQPRMTTTNCTWMGNMLNCTSMRLSIRLACCSLDALPPPRKYLIFLCVELPKPP